jgi:23S rRNA pseudouridine1911/1915/1917 synthase
MGKMMEVLYEDNHVIVVVKPANIPVMEDSSEDEDLLNMVKGYIKEKYNKPGEAFAGIVHRLDRPVGGVMVFARTSKAASRLSEQVRNRSFGKTYLAVVTGRVQVKKGVLRDYLVKDEEKNTSHVSDSSNENAKLAELEYEVMDSKDKYSLLKVDLHTGRHHQIRVQLSNMGCPIYADARYSQDNIKAPIALWAWRLSFNHPVTKERMEFTKEPDYSGFPWTLFR